MSIIHFDWAEHQAQMRPNKIAIKDYTLNEEVSYSELNSKASKIANYLQNKKVRFTIPSTIPLTKKNYHSSESERAKRVNLSQSEAMGKAHMNPQRILSTS